MVIEFLLQFVKTAIPHLISCTGAPGICTVVVRTKIPDLVALRGIPGIEFWIGGRFCQFMTRCRRGRVSCDVAVGRRRAANLAHTRIAKRLVPYTTVAPPEP